MTNSKLINTFGNPAKTDAQKLYKNHREYMWSNWDTTWLTGFNSARHCSE